MTTDPALMLPRWMGIEGRDDTDPERRVYSYGTTMMGYSVDAMLAGEHIADLVGWFYERWRVYVTDQGADPDRLTVWGVGLTD